VELLETLRVHGFNDDRRIELLLGDLSHIPMDHEVDAVAVSAFGGDYVPVPGTLIGALADRGVSVGQLSQDKEVDLLDISRCWLSRPIDRPDLHFRHILCIEPPKHKTAPADAVADVFDSLVPYITREPWITRVAMPLLASGMQGADPLVMLEAILDAATRWFSAGLPLTVLKIVVYERESPDLVSQAVDLFRRHAPVHDRSTRSDSRKSREYDLFVSYSHRDAVPVRSLVERIKALDPTLRVYIDHAELHAGSVWQQDIFEAMEVAPYICCFLSPDYLDSRMCIREFNIALMRSIDEDANLMPAYLRTAEKLPAYMRSVQYEDVRESDAQRLEELAREIVRRTSRSSNAPQSDTGTLQPGSSEQPGGDLRGHSPSLVASVIDGLLNGREIKFEVKIRRVE
jgi:hypothetical protein